MNGWAMETFAPKIRINDFHSPEFRFRFNDFHSPEFGFGLPFSVAQGFSPGLKKNDPQKRGCLRHFAKNQVS